VGVRGSLSVSVACERASATSKPTSYASSITYECHPEAEGRKDPLGSGVLRRCATSE